MGPLGKRLFGLLAFGWSAFAVLLVPTLFWMVAFTVPGWIIADCQAEIVACEAMTVAAVASATIG